MVRAVSGVVCGFCKFPVARALKIANINRERDRGIIRETGDDQFWGACGTKRHQGQQYWSFGGEFSEVVLSALKLMFKGFKGIVTETKRTAFMKSLICMEYIKYGAPTSYHPMKRFNHKSFPHQNISLSCSEYQFKVNKQSI
jgi:hypothetical protein